MTFPKKGLLYIIYYLLHLRAREAVTTVKTLRIISKTVSITLLSSVVLLAILLGATRLVGLTPYTVLSNSMDPTYPVGSVIYVRTVDTEELEKGDVITYRLPGGTVVTHRIEEVLGTTPEDRSFRTKGDANETPDGSPVAPSAIIGEALFGIPFLGYISEFVQHPSGMIALLAICAAVLILTFAVDGLLAKMQAEQNAPEEEPSEQNR